MTREEWVSNKANGDDDDSPPPDAVAAAAARLGEFYGWWYDPVLSPETAIEMAALILGEEDE